MFLDRLPQDIQRKIWKECCYHRLQNPFHVLGSGSFFELLRKETKNLVICSKFNFTTEPGTVTLNSACNLEEALSVVAAVGSSVTELCISAPLFIGADASIFFQTLVKHSTSVRSMKIEWTTKEASLNSELICILSKGIGPQIVKLDIETQQSVPDDVMECLVLGCKSIQEFRYKGYMMRISLRSHWHCLCSNLKIVDVSEAKMTGRDWSWLLKMLKYFSPGLTTLRLGRHRLTKSQAKDLKRVYVKHANCLLEASLSSISPYSCEEIVRKCKKLKSVSILEDDELYRRISILGHRIHNLYLILPDDVNNRNLKESMANCDKLVSLRVSHQRAMLREGLFATLFSNTFPFLEVLEVHLHGSSITNIDINYISRATGNLKQLHLTGEAEYNASSLRSLFEINQSLAKVSFSTRPGTEVASSLRDIVESLSKCPCLKELRWDRYRPADVSTIEEELKIICTPVLKRGVLVIVSGVMLEYS